MILRRKQLLWSNLFIIFVKYIYIYISINNNNINKLNKVKQSGYVLVLDNPNNV